MCSCHVAVHTAELPPPPESTFLGLKQGVRLGHRYRGFGYKGLDVD